MEGRKMHYKDYAEERAKKSNILTDCIRAFIVGGAICTLGQLFHDFYVQMGLTEKESGTLVSVTLIFLTALLTGLGVFDNIAKVGGAGTLVPITGFANSVVSPAIDNKAEGMILGLGAKIFIIAGPVILYGTLASVVYGVIYWLMQVV
ncbi:MAG: stage V sporulation protein AC [Ruminococcaceae bacterium]|nr:stage V sporulation protein AC [Oscillospiraceae bacterium]